MTFIPRNVLRLGLETMRHSAQVMEALTPAEGRIAWRELQNKLQAFTCFSYANELSSSNLDPYSRLWVTEGIGFLRAESAVKGGPAQGDLVPLHTGMGLKFACRAMEGPGPVAPRIARFLDLCDRHALDGYRGACYEALGLVVCNLYPESLLRCDKALDEPLRGYFWHGVGRGLYFIPSNLLPMASAPWRCVQMAQRDPPDEIGRMNAICGLVWAVALVNIRHPEVLELFGRHHAGDLPGDACEDGARSALRVWESFVAGSGRDDFYPGECFHYVNDRYGAKH